MMRNLSYNLLAISSSTSTLQSHSQCFSQLPLPIYILSRSKPLSPTMCTGARARIVEQYYKLANKPAFHSSPIPKRPLVYKTLLEVARATNNYEAQSQTRYYWPLLLEGDTHQYGKVSNETVKGLGEVIEALNTVGEEAQSYPNLLGGWNIDSVRREITLLGSTKEARDAVLGDTCRALTTLASKGPERFLTLTRLRNELEAVFAPDGTVAFNCERAMTVMFGLPGYGIQACMYYKTASGKYRIAVAKRAADKATYPSKLDVVVGGCVANDPSTGLPSTAFDTLLKEGEEEAKLAAQLLKDRAKLGGFLSYTTVRDHPAVPKQTINDYFVHDDIMTLWFIEVSPQVTLTVNDGEVETFYWLYPQELIRALKQGECKPNSALALLSLLLHLGELNKLPADELRGIRQCLFSPPKFPLSQDVKQNMQILGLEKIEDQQDPKKCPKPVFYPAPNHVA